MSKKKLDLSFQVKNIRGQNKPIKDSTGIIYNCIGEFLAEALFNLKSENSIKLKGICEELYKNKGMVERDITDINFLKEHIKRLQLPTYIEAPVLEVFENIKR